MGTNGLWFPVPDPRPCTSSGGHCFVAVSQVQPLPISLPSGFSTTSRYWSFQTVYRCQFCGAGK
jgi:hypothetical protein